LVKDCPQLSVREFEAIQKLIDERLLPALNTAREALTGAFATLRGLTADQCSQIGRDVKWRLTEAVLADPELREAHQRQVLPAVEELRQLVRYCTFLCERLKEIAPTPKQPESPVATEVLQLRAYTKRIERMANVLAEGTSETLHENTVRWIEIDAKNENIVRIVRCPLEVGKPLAEWVYENLQSVVMTSATLTVQRRFTYLFKRLGLDLVDAKRIESLSLDSPFDFTKQALLGIPNDLSDPNEKGFLEQSEDCIRQILRITRGRAFVLFTSFFALDHACRRLQDELRGAGITPLRQGSATRTQLLDHFRSDTASVLFATDSFWEGVDVAGESLQCVILPKLPFRVPTEPILQARAEVIEAAGGNAFMEYAVPQAVIKFRQGFGRLIRRRSDRGVIVVLDRRVITKYYGRVFVESLPEVRIIKGPQRGVLLALKEFFGKHNEDQT